MNFEIKRKLLSSGKEGLGRAGVLETPHGAIETPAFVTVGTKATVKALTPEQVKDLGAQVVLGNTYHLYLEPGENVVQKAGSLGKFMNWPGPTMTDSGGFQVFSLGAAFDSGVSKVTKPEGSDQVGGGAQNARKKSRENLDAGALAKVTEDGVEFRSHIDGSKHFFTPEKSMQIQAAIGADIIFAFDECTTPQASYEYQKEALDRTHRWAERSLKEHQRHENNQALFGIVQGARYQDLREESARCISGMDFDGFGIGGSFEKKDMNTAVGWVNNILPEEKPRHLLGIGEPADLFGGIENGVDLFDCVAPTRIARNGQVYTETGKINLYASKFRYDFSPIDSACGCYACRNYTKSYLSHLFRSREMLSATLASIHNLYFIVHLVKKIRQSILDGNFFEYRQEFLKKYEQK